MVNNFKTGISVININRLEEQPKGPQLVLKRGYADRRNIILEKEY